MPRKPPDSGDGFGNPNTSGTGGGGRGRHMDGSDGFGNPHKGRPPKKRVRTKKDSEEEKGLGNRSLVGDARKPSRKSFTLKNFPG